MSSSDALQEMVEKDGPWMWLGPEAENWPGEVREWIRAVLNRRFWGSLNTLKKEIERLVASRLSYLTGLDEEKMKQMLVGLGAKLLIDMEGLAQDVLCGYWDRPGTRCREIYFVEEAVPDEADVERGVLVLGFVPDVEVEAERWGYGVVIDYALNVTVNIRVPRGWVSPTFTVEVRGEPPEVVEYWEPERRELSEEEARRALEESLDEY